MSWTEPKVYAVKHKNEGVRAASQSGGAFTVLSDMMLKEGGVVYGCALTEDFQAVHIRAEDCRTRDLMRGSKYIQSKLGDTYKKVEDDLQSGRKVLFSGTSCQVAGLRRFLGKEYGELFCVDIICHGVPSPLIWKKYIRWQTKRRHGRLSAVDFRNKIDFGWRSHVETLTMADGRKINSRIFATLFYGHNALRPSCHVCPYKSVMHPGDITIGDYWGIEKAVPEFDDNKGVSIVLINSATGEAAFEAVKEYVYWKSTKIEDSMQEPLKAPFPKPAKRDLFWEDFRKKDFRYIAGKYGGNSLKSKIRRRLGIVKRRILKKVSSRE